MSKGQETRIRIITVATDLFLSEGLYDVTFLKIAKGAGLTQTAIYRHFEDMDDLILQACQHWVDSSVQYIAEDITSLRRANLQMKQYLERHLIYAAKNRAHDGLLFGLYYYSMRSKKMLQVYGEIKMKALAKIKYILDLGNIDGSWKIADTNAMAITVHSLVVGEIIKLLIEPKAEPKEIRLARVTSDIAKILT